MKYLQNPYPVPVDTSSASAGTAVSKGWRIIVIKDSAFFVKKNCETFTRERYP